jgi:hypothetical protein
MPGPVSRSMSLSGIAVATGRLRGPEIAISPCQTRLPVSSMTCWMSSAEKLSVSLSASSAGTRLRSLTRSSLRRSFATLIVVTGKPGVPSRGNT